VLGKAANSGTEIKKNHNWRKGGKRARIKLMNKKHKKEGKSHGSGAIHPWSGGREKP